MDPGYVYILKSKTNDRYYIGASENPARRLEEHNRGFVVATRGKGPWGLQFKQIYFSLQEAKRIEYKLKKLKRRDILEKIITEKEIRIK